MVASHEPMQYAMHKVILHKTFTLGLLFFYLVSFKESKLKLEAILEANEK